VGGVGFFCGGWDSERRRSGVAGEHGGGRVFQMTHTRRGKRGGLKKKEETWPSVKKGKRYIPLGIMWIRERIQKGVGTRSGGGTRRKKKGGARGGLFKRGGKRHLQRFQITSKKRKRHVMWGDQLGTRDDGAHWTRQSLGKRLNS